MDFGVLDGLVSSENNNNKNTLTSSCDLDVKTKWFGSDIGFCKQESNVSATHEDEWRDLKMAKVIEDDISKTMLLQQQQHRSNGGQSMLSFSSPNTQSSVRYPYYARNNIVAAGPFTPSQWMELEHQALIYRYITANAAIPSNLLIPIRKALETAAFCSYSGRQNTYGWGGLHLGFCNSSDPEPGRCRRTDGKKWRCSKDAVPDQKYCERHMNRGRHRSRKPVEAQNCNSATVGTGKIAAGSAVFRRSAAPNPTACSQDNRKATMEATIVPMLHSSSVAPKKNEYSTPEETSSITKFGLVSSGSLLNSMHNRDLKSQNSLHHFMEEWPHSSQVSTTSERLDLSPLTMSLGMSNQVNRVPGGPLGEVLQHSTNNSPTSLNTMTEQMGSISHKMQLGYLL